ncbi:uncharacterized protein [Dermacentor albipictus]|uniref:uncharacterized protein n=1 Tax=Dermacentor albipictus TaxID=60249 RepID=UPI0038FCA736
MPGSWGRGTEANIEVSGVNLLIEEAEQPYNEVPVCSPISIEVPLNTTAFHGSVPDVPLPNAVADHIEASQEPNRTVAALQKKIAELEAQLHALQRSSALAHKHKRKAINVKALMK